MQLRGARRGNRVCFCTRLLPRIPHSGCKRLRLDCLIHISDEAAPSLDDLTDAVYDCLDQLSDKGRDNSFQTILVENAFETDSGRSRLHATTDTEHPPAATESLNRPGISAP